MSTVERKAGDFVIDAALLAEAFALSQDEVKAQMRTGTITSRCEAGVDDDAGRWRLTFFRGDRALRLTVDAAGDVLSRATFPVAPRPEAAPGADGPA
jgi:hypothetical protein